MKIFLERAIFVNRAPFEHLDLSFRENEIVVLTSVNGKGKTTIISYIVDSLYEIARPHFPKEFEDRPNKFYRISATGFNQNSATPSFVYLRFKTELGNVDYLDIRNLCTREEYEQKIGLDDKIPFEIFSRELQSHGFVKKVSANVTKEIAIQIFNHNILTYFPSYRYERPGYLNDPYQININFKKRSEFTGLLTNPIEVMTTLPQLANWLMDILLDATVYPHSPVRVLLDLANHVLTQMLISKEIGNLRFGIGQRGLGATRLQIMRTEDNTQVYSNVFNLSSGELAVLCLFLELLRQGDRINSDVLSSEISGIVLIDEVEKHLHIKLQKEVLPSLLNLFPNTQFIMSSHSPFLGMGLAEQAAARTKIMDLGNFGASTGATTNELYNEVYEMMVGENERFKEMYDTVTEQVEAAKTLQVVTEGKNTEHIEKAIQILEPELLNEIQIIRGVEDRTGAQQLKNTFEVMSKANHVNPFLFVWDCDAAGMAAAVAETDNFRSFAFGLNEQNTKSLKGIENLYSEGLFDYQVYDTIVTPLDYGGSKTEERFNKEKFLNKVKNLVDEDNFAHFVPLLTKIHEIINAQEVVEQVPNGPEADS